MFLFENKAIISGGLQIGKGFCVGDELLCPHSVAGEFPIFPIKKPLIWTDDEFYHLIPISTSRAFDAMIRRGRQ